MDRDSEGMYERLLTILRMKTDVTYVKAAALYLGLMIGIAGAAVLLGVILGMILLRMKEKIAERTETWFAQILYYLFGIST